MAGMHEIQKGGNANKPLRISVPKPSVDIPVVSNRDYWPLGTSLTII